MTLRSYLRILRAQWLVIVLFVIAATGTAVLVTNLTPKSYQSTAQVFLSANLKGGAALNAQSNNYLQTLVATYAKVVDSQQVLQPVAGQVDLGLSYQQLRDKIDATTTVGQSIIDVNATDSSARIAAELANTAATQFTKYLPTVTTGVKAVVISPAVAASSPVDPKPALDITLGVLLGLLLGAAFAVLRDLLDNRVKDADSLAKVAAAPIMGTVVEDPTTRREVIATHAGTHNVRAENFRQLRTNLQFANVDSFPRVVAVTSSIPEEGKTTVAINLASALAEAGFSVCLVDTDLRRPMIGAALGLVGSAGLTNVLIQQIGLSEVLQHAGDNLYVLTSGPTPPNPSEVLASTYVRDVVRSLLDKVDFVVLDTAPLLPVADGSEVAALADGTLLVVRFGETTEPSVRRAAESLRRVDAKLLGVVLNRVPPRLRRDEYGYAYYRSVGEGEPGASNEPGLRRQFGRARKAAHSRGKDTTT